MAMTDDQFRALLQGFLQSQETMMRGIFSSQAAAQTAQREQRRASQAPDMAEMSDSELDGDTPRMKDQGKLVSKFIKADSFSGDASKWDDWSFKFKRSVNTMNRDMCRLMTVWESREDEIDEEQHMSRDFQQRSAELYDILCERCDGEALMIIRQVNDMEGVRAWQKLFNRYNPRTMARGLRLLSEAVNPPRAKSLADVETLVSRWEDRVKRLETQFQETISDKMRMAIFTNIMPVAIQDYIYTHADKETKYVQLREKVQAMIGNKISVSTGPVPMDIGDVKGKSDDNDDHCGDYYWDDIEVDGVGDDYCLRCGGYGHYAKDCPTKSKGKGKGLDKGKGKGFFKGKGDYNNNVKGKGDYNYNYGAKGKSDYNHNAKGKGKSSKGKGYQGTCWNCGKVGHKANECNTRAAYLVEEAEDDEQVEGIGGVWEVLVANVTTADAPRTSRWGPTASTTRTTASAPATTPIGQKGPTTTNDLQKTTVAKKVYTSGATTASSRTSGKKTACASPTNPCGRMTTSTQDSTQDNTTTMDSSGKTWAQVVTQGGKTTMYPPGLKAMKTHNRFTALQRHEDDDDIDEVNEVHTHTSTGEKWTRPSSMTFNLAGVTKPLASAAQVVASGNRIVLDPQPDQCFVENVKTGERMRLREHRGVYVFDVQYDDGEEGTITLDSGAGVSVWPAEWAHYAAETMPRKPGLKMIAANGTPIENVGRAKVVLRGRRPPVFSRPSQ